MTRGTLYIVEKIEKKIRVTNSCEFNGDMYEEERGGHGGEVMRLLKKTTNQKEFEENVREFDKETFGYQQEEKNDVTNYFTFYETYARRNTWLEKQGNLVTVSFKDYFENFFSDWTFWKNCTEDCNIMLTTFKTHRRYGIIDLRTKKVIPDVRVAEDAIKLEPGETVAIYFGKHRYHYREAPILLKGGKK